MFFNSTLPLSLFLFLSCLLAHVLLVRQCLDVAVTDYYRSSYDVGGKIERDSEREREREESERERQRDREERRRTRRERGRERERIVSTNQPLAEPPSPVMPESNNNDRQVLLIIRNNGQRRLVLVESEPLAVWHPLWIGALPALRMVRRRQRVLRQRRRDQQRRDARARRQLRLAVRDIRRAHQRLRRLLARA